MTETKIKRKHLFNQITRKAIQEAVVNLVTRTGTRKVTMDQVAAEAGMSKGCLYIHFRNKKELLESVKTASFKPLVDQVQEILKGSLSPNQKIESIVYQLFSYFDENRGLFRFLLEEREIAQSQAKRQKNSRYRNFVERIAKVLDDGVATGMFRHMDSKKVASIFIEAMIAMTARRLLEESPGPLDEDVRLLIQVLFRGITFMYDPQPTDS
ncbi:MAG TPA: TetR/AcrR family transcriptional regulator [Desulfobacterales bacterium]|nr:TetR/AcrR family transcriptional regulator [Desulfobacterales bacterium]